LDHRGRTKPSGRFVQSMLLAGIQEIGILLWSGEVSRRALMDLSFLGSARGCCVGQVDLTAHLV